MLLKGPRLDEPMKYPIVLLAALLTFGCSKHDDKPPEPPPPSTANLQGQWSGAVTSGQNVVNVALSLTQSGTAITGDWATTAQSGTASGNVNGTTFTFTLTETVPCPGSYSGSGNVSGNTLSASYAGSDCHGQINASGALTRQTSTTAIDRLW